MSCYTRKFEFYPGEDKTLAIQLNLYNRDRDCREPYDATLSGPDTLSIEVPSNGAAIIVDLLSTPPVVVDSALFGKIHVDLTAAQTMLMGNGSVTVKATKAGKTTIFAGIASIVRMTIPNC